MTAPVASIAICIPTYQRPVAAGLRFDRYFDFMGSEDNDFFQRARDRGARAVWTNEAVAFETVPPARQTRRYRFYRHFTGGISIVLRYRRHHGLAGALYQLALAALMPRRTNLDKARLYHQAAGLSARRARLDMAMIIFAHGLGCLCGLCNIKIERYRHDEP